jgi:hypothetical protein
MQVAPPLPHSHSGVLMQTIPAHTTMVRPPCVARARNDLFGSLSRAMQCLLLNGPSCGVFHQRGALQVNALDFSADSLRLFSGVPTMAAPMRCAAECRAPAFVRHWARLGGAGQLGCLGWDGMAWQVTRTAC